MIINQMYDIRDHNNQIHLVHDLLSFSGNSRENVLQKCM